MFTELISTLPSFKSLLEPIVLFFAEQPVQAIFQTTLLSVGAISVYLLFYTLRDILVRSRSLALQLVSILLVATLPIVGFFLYLLIRPAHTVRQRQLATDITSLLGEIALLKKKQSTVQDAVQKVLEKKKQSTLQSFKKKRVPTSS